MTFVKNLLLLSGIALFSSQIPAIASPTVSVPDFKNKAGNLEWWNKNVGKQLSDVLSNELTNAGVQVVERAEFDAVLSEQELSELGIVSKNRRNNNTAETKRMRGAQFIILGGVSAYEEGVETESKKSSSAPPMASILGVKEESESGASTAYVAVDLRIVNSTTGEIVGARSVEGRATSTFKSSQTKLDGSGFGSFVKESGGPAFMQKAFSDFQVDESSVEVNKAPKEKAIRAALISASEYVNCVLVLRNSCIAEFEAQDKKRRQKTLNILKFD
tara:strand:+ start:1125 stop:1946 length:822 start_codon:yes stop_codon:yes gene_type:complete